jgi:hypothetical protein
LSQLSSRLSAGIKIRIQLETNMQQDEQAVIEEKQYLNSAKAQIKSKLANLSKVGQTFDVYVMNDNRKHLMGYISDKIQNPDQHYVNLNLVDKKEVNLEMFTRNGIIDDRLLEQAYRHYHRFNFEQMLSKNQVKIKNQFLDRVQQDFASKKSKMLVSRSQFANLQSQMAFLNKKSKQKQSS